MSKEKDYQVLSGELDAVLAALQEPNVAVTKAVKLYEQGLKLIAELEKYVAQAENKLETLSLHAVVHKEE